MKFNIIYLDPAWYFPKRNNLKTKFGGGITDKYPPMKIEDIKNLPIQDLADDNCAIFMWITTSMTSDSDIIDKLSLLKHWGFKIPNIAFNWKKEYKNGKTHFGTGYYTKSGSELCILGIKGKMKPISNYISSIVESPLEYHSKKPDIIADKIVELFGDLPRIELFARQPRNGWITIGQELSGLDIKDDIKRIIEL